MKALALWREHRRSPAQTLAALLALTIGVAGVVAVDLASSTIDDSFAEAAATIRGAATHRLVAPGGISPDQFRRLRQVAGSTPMSPVIELEASINDSAYTVLGVDILSRSAFATGSGALSTQAVNLESWFGGRALVAAPAALFQIDQPLTVRYRDAEYSAAVGVLIDTSASVLLADLSLVARWQGEPTLTHVDVVASSARELAWLESRMPPEFVIQTLDDSDATITEAFRFNLLALTALMTLVAALIVFNAMRFALIRRAPWLQSMAAIGVSPRSLRRLMGLEVSLFGLIALALGVPMGVVLSHTALGAMAQTINDLYAGAAVRRPTPDVETVARAALVLTASLLPVALGAARRAVALAYGAKVVAWPAWIFPLLTSVLLLGVVMTVFAANVGLAIVGILLGALAYAMLAPVSMRWILTRMAPPQIQRRWAWALASRRLPRTIEQSGPAVAAMTLALAAIYGIGGMIEGFRDAVEQWLGQSLSADYYLAGAPSNKHRDQALALPGVAGVSRFLTARTETSVGRREVSLAELTRRGAGSYEFVERIDGDLWRHFADGGVLISESLARLSNLSVGDQLSWSGACGRGKGEIIAVVVDYRAGAGRILAPWPADCTAEPSSLGVDMEAVHSQNSAALSAFARSEGLRLVSREEIIDASLVVFDRTFVLAHALKWIAMFVALVGLVGALAALHFERARELELLGCIGLSRRQQQRVQQLEGLLLGGFCAATALPAGWMLGTALARKVNPLAFGWRLDFDDASASMLITVLVGVGGALLASSLVGRGAREA